MPSTSAKQHRFMAAIANNPAFAKKVGVPQSVGKDYAAADKGKKFAAGGVLAKVNKQDTKHGAMDMPFKKLNKFAGMKKGGKIKRYEDGGDVDEGISSYAEPQKSTRLSGEKTEGPQGKLEDLKIPDRTPRPVAKPVAKPVAPSAKPAEAKATPSGTTNAGAASSMAPRGQLGRLAAKSAGLSDEAKEEAGKRTGLAIASFAPVGRALQGLHRLGAGIKAERAERAASSMSGRVAERQAEMAKARASRVEKANKEARREAEYDARRASDMEAGYKKGGMTKRFAKGGVMKESKAMVGKEVAFMKKKGAPASMIKHEKAEMSAMKKGGMMRYAKGGRTSIMDTIEKYNEGAKETIAEGEKNTRDAGDAAVDAFNKGKYGTALKEGAKGLGSAAKTLAVDVPVEAFRAGMNRLAYGKKMARGGGIESRGKTKGTIVKMATGGVVKFARGGGIESRGKTKGTMIKMNKGGYC